MSDVTLTDGEVAAAVSAIERTHRLMALVILLAGAALATDATVVWVASGVAQLTFLVSLLWLAIDIEPVRRKLGYRDALALGCGRRRAEYPATSSLRRSTLIVVGCFAVAAVVIATTVPGGR